MFSSSTSVLLPLMLVSRRMLELGWETGSASCEVYDGRKITPQDSCQYLQSWLFRELLSLSPDSGLQPRITCSVS